MLKKFSIILIVFLLLTCINGYVFADDTYSTTTTINGVTINWKYELNDSKEIENLKCTNVEDLVGDIVIPDNIEGDSVISLDEEAFKDAINITGLVIPNTIKEISYSAFENCSNLESIDLGRIKKISFDVFKDCPKLTTVTIPNTLVDGPGEVEYGVFTGTTNLTSVIFEEGTTVIASGILKDCEEITEVKIPDTATEIGEYAFSNSGLTEVTLPNSVKEVSYNAFENCSDLSSVNLGQLEKISFDVFKDCPKLTTLTLPSTLIDGLGEVDHGVFTGTTNLTSVTFEEGTTIIASGILKDCKGIKEVVIPNTVTEIDVRAFSNSGLTEITLPSSVKEISYNAFENCSELSTINLGQLEKISFDVFKDCPKLTTITIPSTLKAGPGEVDCGVFTGTTSLTSVTFEEGTTVIASGILKDCKEITEITIPDTVTKIGSQAFENSGITEITFSNSLQEIERYAFNNCYNLTKITILDNCTKIGWYNIEPTKDSVFQNHNEDLTIYCYENSKIEEYAIANNIKYEHIERQEIDNDIDEVEETNPKEVKLVVISVFAILIISIVCIIFWVKHKKSKNS